MTSAGAHNIIYLKGNLSEIKMSDIAIIKRTSLLEGGSVQKHFY